MAYYAKRSWPTCFKIKLTQELKPLDHLKRRNFSNWALAKLEENEEFHGKNIFSDEAHFWLNGFVNKQNMRYWSATNPNMLLETPLHPQKVTVWCGFHAGGVMSRPSCHRQWRALSCHVGRLFVARIG